MPKTKQPELNLPVPVHCSGDPWKPDNDNPATVPIPNAVIITKIEGPFTERDRKLWTFLIHAVWDELLVKRYHEIPISRIDRIFRELDGGHEGVKWIWDSVKRLTKTHVEWEEGPDSRRLVGVSNLINAKTDKSSRLTGILWFQIPDFLAEVIKQPFRFSRIRLHFMMGLSGKYSVTLYELLESAANLKNPMLEVELSKLRQWLKVPEGKLQEYYDLKRRVLEPALKQINENPQGAGFTVETEPIKEGRAVDRIRFTMTKTQTRIEEEKLINKARSIKKTLAEPETSAGNICLSLETYEKARRSAPGMDVYFLEREWREWSAGKGEPVKNPDGAFINFCKSRAKKNCP